MVTHVTTDKLFTVATIASVHVHPQNLPSLKIYYYYYYILLYIYLSVIMFRLIRLRTITNNIFQNKQISRNNFNNNNNNIYMNTNINNILKRLFSDQNNLNKASRNLTFPILIASAAVGSGAVLVAYQYGYLSKSSKQELLDQLNNSIIHEMNPKTSNEPILVNHLPESVPYLIVGGGTAGYIASRTIRSNDPKSRVLIISAEEYLPYMRPPISKELWYSGSDLKDRFTFKQWNGREKSIFFEPQEFFLPLDQFETAPNGGISVVNGHMVVKIDPTDRKAFLENGQVISYEKCLLATGGEPKNLEVFENVPEVKERVILYRNINDFKKLEEIFSRSKSITVIGGGLLGSELASALTDKAKRIKSKVHVTQIMPEQGVLEKFLPQYLSKWCSNKALEEGKFCIDASHVFFIFFFFC